MVFLTLKGYGFSAILSSSVSEPPVPRPSVCYWIQQGRLEHARFRLSCDNAACYQLFGNLAAAVLRSSDGLCCAGGSLARNVRSRPSFRLTAPHQNSSTCFGNHKTAAVSVSEVQAAEPVQAEQRTVCANCSSVVPGSLIYQGCMWMLYLWMKYNGTR